jgi:hypothetical protein
MTGSNLTKVMVVLAVSSIFVVLVAAPLVGAQNSNHDKNHENKQQGTQDAQHQNANLTTSPGDPTSPSPSDTSVHWASITTNNGTPAVRNASDSSTSVAPNTGTPGAYTVTFPDNVHALGCTATSNSGTQATNQGPISCGLGDDTELQPNQVQVLTTSGNSNPEQGSDFTVVAYDTPASSG